jgi:serine/threonine-protein kinase
MMETLILRRIHMSQIKQKPKPGGWKEEQKLKSQYVWSLFSGAFLVLTAACSVPAPSTEIETPESPGNPMILIPAGEFTMGGKADDAVAMCVEFNLSCPIEFFQSEEPLHQVHLDAFWIDQTEVTNLMYSKCVQAGKCTPPTSKESLTRANYYGDPQFDNYPVIFISWQEADAYCSWAGHRLPTEAEWEKAARGEDARAYPWGNEAPNTDLLNYKHAFKDTTVVGQFQRRHPYGVLDMAGNVWEWTADWFGDTFYAESPAANPLGPESGIVRVLRGGAFGSQVFNVRSTFRLLSEPADTYAWVGFRCARDE